MLAAGTRFGHYEVSALVGAGGMGEVYRARDTRLKREVALKILPPALASDPSRLARFQREAELLAALDHPHIAVIYGVEEAQTQTALVLQLVEGETLAERIARGPLPTDDALHVAGQIAQALAAAHAQGIVHRDLKPSNIVITSTGVVKVLDFGLAKLIESPALDQASPLSPTMTSPAVMTGAGMLLGTAAYMSPEQAKGKREAHAWPDVLRGGRHVLFTITSVGLDDSRIALLDLETKTHRVIIQRGTYPRYSNTGHLLYASGGTIFAVGFDVERLAVTTTPVALVDGVITKESGAANFDIADNGTLVYTPGSAPRATRTIAWVDQQGGATPIAALPPGEYRSVRLNHNATQLVFEAGPIGDSDLWTLDLQRGVRNPLTRGQADDRNPLWTADERRVVFGSNRDGVWGVFGVNADGSGSVERLLQVDGAVELWPSSWSPDHQTLAFSMNAGGDGDIGLVRIGDNKIDWRLKTPTIEGLGAISPDGRWIAYASQRSGRGELYVERFPELGDRQPVSSEGLQGGPVWSRDGRELYYVDRTRAQMMAVTIRDGDRIGIGTPRVRFKVPVFVLRGWRTYDVAPDGRFIIITDDSAPADVVRAMPIAVQNWAEELKRRVPTD